MDKKYLIITGGSIDCDFAMQYIGEHPFDRVISADAGMEFCKRADMIPDLFLGDFDSVNPQTLDFFQKKCPERIERFPVQKDETDTELALIRAIEQGADRITILGGTGSRLDHVLGNLQLLQMAMNAGVECFLVDAHNRIRMIRNPLVVKKAEQFGTYISLIPFTQTVSGLTLKGFAYEAEDETLLSGKTRGVSNEIREDEGRITFADGILLVIESRD